MNRNPYPWRVAQPRGPGRPMTWEERVDRAFPMAIVAVALVGAVGWGRQDRWIEVGTALVIALSLGWMAAS